MSHVHGNRVGPRVAAVGGAQGNALAEAIGKPYWNEDDARIVVDAWAESGETLSSFARLHGFGRHKLDWWRKRLPAAVEASAAPQARWLPVRVVAARGTETSASAIDGGAMEVVLAGDRCVRVWPGFDAVAVRRLVEALEVTPC